MKIRYLPTRSFVPCSKSRYDFWLSSFRVSSKTMVIALSLVTIPLQIVNDLHSHSSTKKTLCKYLVCFNSSGYGIARRIGNATDNVANVTNDSCCQAVRGTIIWFTRMWKNNNPTTSSIRTRHMATTKKYAKSDIISKSLASRPHPGTTVVAFLAHLLPFFQPLAM